jgi:hypothetical protein
MRSHLGLLTRREVTKSPIRNLRTPHPCHPLRIAMSLPPPTSSSSQGRNKHHKASSRHKKEKRSRRSPRSKSKRKKEEHRHSKPGRRNQYGFQSDDPSTGDPKRIYGMPINGQKIDSAISSNKMKKSDRSFMYTAAVDVASLPGGWHQTKGVSEELFTETQKMAQLTSTILQAAGKLKHTEIQDTTWNSTIRHSLGKIKSRDDVFASMKKLRNSKKSAFQQQDNLIEHFLYRCHYSSKYIQEYLQTSLPAKLGDLSL